MPEMSREEAKQVLGMADKIAFPFFTKMFYRREALKHHPDRGGDPEKMKEVNAAWSVLEFVDERTEANRPNDPYEAFRQAAEEATRSAREQEPFFESFHETMGRDRPPPRGRPEGRRYWEQWHEDFRQRTPPPHYEPGTRDRFSEAPPVVQEIIDDFARLARYYSVPASVVIDIDEVSSDVYVKLQVKFPRIIYEHWRTR